MELPTAPDNSLFMTTLQASFPGATGLKYKNPKTGALRAVAVDATGTKLLPPADGWDDKVFTVITPSARADKGSDVSVKRRKIGSSDGESDSDGEGRVGRKRAADRDLVNERQPVDLIVLGVNYKTTDEGFKKYFETFGPVSFAELKRSNRTMVHLKIRLCANRHSRKHRTRCLALLVNMLMVRLMRGPHH
ncbi:hypothetical protein COOONC_06794 [Cooperia oncophora]